MKVHLSGSKKITGRWPGWRWIAGTFVLLVIVLVAPTSAAPLASPNGTCAGSDTVICIDPATQTINPNQTTTVDIRIDNVTNLFGADVTLSFNPFILCAQDGADPCPNQAVDVQLTPGPIFTSAGAGKYLVWFNFADNSTGMIQFTVIRLGSTTPAFTGSGVLATVTFVGRGGPQSPIRFTYSKLSDRSGTEITAPTQDGVIYVTGPTAVVLSSFGTEISTFATLEANSNSTLIVALGTIGALLFVVGGLNVVRNKRKGQSTRI